MRLLDHGYAFMKFFPAEPGGGRHYLKALATVIWAGGSWAAPVEAGRAGDWATIEGLARDAVALGRAVNQEH